MAVGQSSWARRRNLTRMLETVDDPGLAADAPPPHLGMLIGTAVPSLAARRLFSGSLRWRWAVQRALATCTGR